MSNFQDWLERYLSGPDDRIKGALARNRPRSAGIARTNSIPVLASLALVGVATASLFAIRYIVPLNLITLVFLLPVVVAATRWGIVPGVTASIAGAAMADFFFFPPLYSFWIHDPQHVIDLLLFLFVAIVTSNLAARLRKEAESLRRREGEIRDLYAFSQRLAACFTTSDLIFAIQDYLSNTLGYRAVLIATPQQSHNIEWSDPGNIPEQIRQEAADLIATNVPHARTTIDASTLSTWLIRVVSPEASGYGAIAVDLGRNPREGIEIAVRRVDEMLEQAAKTLNHLKMAEAIEQAKVKYQADTLRDALVGGVSHELRTPLASIIGSASVLDQASVIVNDGRLHALVAAIQDQATQLDTDIRNLLDATRITAKGVRPRLEWTDPTDIVNAAVHQKGRRLAEHPVHLDVAPNLPLVNVDSVLVEQAFGQLLDNAAKYSSAGSPVNVSARTEQDQVVLSVTDGGLGLTPDEKTRIGRHPFRGLRHPVGSSGSGLGLWVASAFIAANGGTLDVMSQGPGLGTTVSLRLPAAHADIPELAEAVDE